MLFTLNTANIDNIP